MSGFQLVASQIVSEENVEEGALSDLIFSDTGSVKGLKQVFSDGLLGVIFFVKSREIVVKKG